MARRQQPWQWEEVAAIYLLLGAATAGGLLGVILFVKATPKHEWAWIRTPETSVSERAFGNEPEWPGEAPAGWPPPVLVMRWDEWGCSNTLAIGPSGSDNDPRNHYAMEVRHYGWPLKMLARLDCIRSPNGPPSYPAWEVRLVWRGLVGNAVLLAFGWAVLLRVSPVVRAGRRRFRVSRGMCPSCGYDLAGSPGGVCPECGAESGVKA